MSDELRDPSSDEDVAGVLDGVGLGRVEDVGVVAESEQQRRVEDLVGVRQHVSSRVVALYTPWVACGLLPVPAQRQELGRAPFGREGARILTPARGSSSTK